MAKKKHAADKCAVRRPPKKALKSNPGGRKMTAAEMAEKLMERADCLRKKHPGVSAKILALEEEMHLRLRKIKDAIEKLPRRDAELLEILAISRMQNTIEETLGSKI